MLRDDEFRNPARVPRHEGRAGVQSPVTIVVTAAPLAPASPVTIAWAGLFALNPAT
jgi:hypothetical protein